MTDVTDSRVLGAPKYQGALGNVPFAGYMLGREVEATAETWAARDVHKDVRATASETNVVFSQNARV